MRREPRAEASPNLSYSIDLEAGLVTLHYAGRPEFEEWARVVQAALDDPRYTPRLGILADRRGVAEAATTPSAQRVVEFLVARRQRIRGRWATVVTGQAAYGMARMVELFLDGALELRAFTDIDEARRWLTEDRQAP